MPRSENESTHAADSVLGVDGARIGKRQGWVTVLLEDGRFVEASFRESFTEVVDAYPGVSTIGVDMPIGLVDSGRREADEAARRFLGRRASSIFLVPARSVLGASEYREACDLSEQAAGARISKQTWAILPRIRELDAWVEAPHVFEVHPEVAFQVLGGTSLAHGKKTWAGQCARRRLLAAARIELPEELGSAAAVPPDDVLDAAIVAWSARRIARGDARSFPAEPRQFDRARPIAIWA